MCFALLNFRSDASDSVPLTCFHPFLCEILLRQSCTGPQCVRTQIGHATQIGHVAIVEKEVQLYSRTSRRFIQIKETEVDARGEKGSQYGRRVNVYFQLAKETVRLGSNK